MSTTTTTTTTAASNDDTTTTTITLEPQAVLSLTDTRKLLKYVWSGALVPTTREQYNFRIGLRDADKSLDGMINDLVSVYGRVNTHCTTFKDTTCPGIVALSSTIFDFAQTAGGTEDDSYYANILAAGKAVFEELKKSSAQQDAGRIAELKETVRELVAAQVTAIEKLREEAKAATQALRDFETECREDQEDLKSKSKPIADKLTGENGEIERLRADIDEKRKKIVEDQAEWEHDVIVASTAVTYIWIFPLGTIAAAITMGIHVDRAQKMVHEIEALNNIINSESAKLTQGLKMVADLGLIKNDLQRILDGIGPAIEAIEKMMGSWDAIANDLKSVGDMVDKQSGKGALVIQRISQAKIVGKWNNIAAEVDAFRKVAYVAAPETKSMDEAVKLFKDLAAK